MGFLRQSNQRTAETDVATAPRTPELARAEELLRELIPRGQVADRFDASYLDDLPEILRELHGITSDGATADPRVAELRPLAGLDASAPLSALAPALRGLGVRDADFTPPHASDKFKKKYHYTRVASWRQGKGVVVGDAPDAVERINKVQEEFSLRSGGARKEVRFDDLGRALTGDPWTPMFRSFITEGTVRADEPVLTLGPRWVGEIHYFRDVIGFKRAIGLDLFSYSSDLVTVGDMHAMPFEDSSFGLIYQRNTFNKSYDIRQALRECVRVLRPGGVLVTDDCLAYTDGVSELARTSMPSNRWALRFLGDNVAEVLHDAETPSGEPWFATIGQLAVRLR